MAEIRYIIVAYNKVIAEAESLSEANRKAISFTKDQGITSIIYKKIRMIKAEW